MIGGLLILTLNLTYKLLKRKKTKGKIKQIKTFFYYALGKIRQISDFLIASIRIRDPRRMS